MRTDASSALRVRPTRTSWATTIDFSSLSKRLPSPLQYSCAAKILSGADRRLTDLGR